MMYSLLNMGMFQLAILVYRGVKFGGACLLKLSARPGSSRYLEKVDFLFDDFWHTDFTHEIGRSRLFYLGEKGAIGFLQRSYNQGRLGLSNEMTGSFIQEN